MQLQFYNLSIFRNMNAVCLAMHYDFSAQGRTGNLIVVDTFKMGCHEGSPGRIVHCLQDIGNVHDDINQQHETRKFMDEFGTKLMAWTPLAEGQNGMFTNPTLTQIGEKYGKTAAQVALRWLLQSDVIIIPKTVHKERMQENLNLFDFELDAEDMQKIAALDTAHSLFLDHHSGETTKQFMEWRAVVKPTE